MYHLRLCKALSYSGLVEATKSHPDVFVEDKAMADKVVATGYFKLVDDKAEKQEGQPAAKTGNLDREQLKSMDYNDLKKLAADMGIDTKAIKKKADLIEAIASAEVKPGEASDEDGNEVDYGEDDSEGSPTMTELQHE